MTSQSEFTATSAAGLQLGSNAMSTSVICDCVDPYLCNVTNMSQYVGKPRMNVDFAEKGDHYCFFAGKLIMFLQYINYTTLISIQPLHVYIDLPGFVKEDINVNVDNSVLTVTAFKKSLHDNDKGVNYHRKERASGKCLRSLRIPSNINADGATCDFLNGVLIVKFPKAANEMHKKLLIH